MFEALSSAVRAIAYASALTGAGSVITLASLRYDSSTGAAQLTRVIRLSGLVLAGATLIAAALFLVRLGGLDDEAARTALIGSPLGAAFALQLFGGLTLAAAAGPLVRQLCAAAILLSFGVVGHAATQGIVSSAAVVLHVSAAAWWLGGLLVLLRASIVMDRKAFASLTMRFSQQAMWIVGLLIAAGATTAALLLQFRFDPAQRYTQMLMVKGGILIVLLGLAGINKLGLAPRIAMSEMAFAWIRRTIQAEIGLVAAALVATAWLTTCYSPHTSGEVLHRQHEQPQVDGPISIIDPWAPAMFPGSQTAAGYLVIVNRQGVEDRLLSASSPWAEQVTLHATPSKGGISKMNELTHLAIPPGKRVALAPGVYHLMFSGLYAPFVEGDDVPISLRFAKAGTVNVTLKVRRFADYAKSHQHQQ
ncbi:MAG: copper chaperone PCu(A)C [Sphingomonadales bacterium]|nr:copper chaperone PCu(A)C [Sphingomonadales bacterium]